MSLRRIEIKSVEEMNEFAVQTSKEIRGGDYLLLTGELGAGKTTFVQGLAKELGVAVPVTSPTFTVVGEYGVSYGKIKKLIHVDLYRLLRGAVENDTAIMGVLEGDSTDRVTVIEWADRLSVNVSGRVWNIDIKHGEGINERIVSVDL